MKRIFVTVVISMVCTHLAHKLRGRAFNVKGLPLIITLIICNSKRFSQQNPWSTFQVIRQVIELAIAKSWVTIKQDKGVTLSSRWLTFGDSISTRELSSHFVVDADIQSVLINLIYPEKILAWNDGVKSHIAF